MGGHDKCCTSPPTTIAVEETKRYNHEINLFLLLLNHPYKLEYNTKAERKPDAVLLPAFGIDTRFLLAIVDNSSIRSFTVRIEARVSQSNSRSLHLLYGYVPARIGTVGPLGAGFTLITFQRFRCHSRTPPLPPPRTQSRPSAQSRQKCSSCRKLAQRLNWRKSRKDLFSSRTLRCIYTR
jgi:hypothetical protein